MWRGLPHATATRRREPNNSSPGIVPLVWDPAGDETAQDAALRAARRVKSGPPDAAIAFSTFQTSNAVRSSEAAAAKGDTRRQSEPGSAHALTAARAAAVSEEARKKQVAAARAARERADKTIAKAADEHAQPLQLARASLATSERCRRLRDQPSRLTDAQREGPSETGRALLVALGVDENDGANPQRPYAKMGGIPHQTPRTRPSSGSLKKESVGGGGGAHVPVSSGRPLSRTPSQSSRSLSASCRSAQTPWLGIGFDGANADPWGRDESLALAHEEPPARGGELEVVCELDAAGHTQLQRLQAELERVRQLEAMLQSEKERGILMGIREP